MCDMVNKVWLRFLEETLVFSIFNVELNILLHELINDRC